MKTIFTLCLTVLILSSCTTSSHLITENYNGEISKTNYQNIKVYSTDKIEPDYEIIGEVIASTDAGTNSKVTVTSLKKEAAKIGADGIINLRLEIDYGYWSTAIKANGTAIKYKK